MHLDADAVSRLLKYGETPVYLSADDLEWDNKGPVAEEEMLVAKNTEDRRRIQRADERRRERKAMRDGEVECQPEEEVERDARKVCFKPLPKERKMVKKE